MVVFVGCYFAAVNTVRKICNIRKGRMPQVVDLDLSRSNQGSSCFQEVPQSDPFPAPPLGVSRELDRVP